MRLMRSFFSNTSGATAIEYGLIVALMSVAVIGGYMAVAGGVNNTWTTISDAYDSTAGG